MPDLVSKLRELSAKWNAFAEGFGNWRDKQAKRECADELESLLGLEGQAAAVSNQVQCASCGATMLADGIPGQLYCPKCQPPCGPSQPEPLEFHKPGQIPVNTPMCDKCGKMFLECQCSQPSPSTPIVPSTAGLSADWPECKEFYDLMQYYRHAPVTDQFLTVKRYKLVKEWLRSQVNVLLATKPGESEWKRAIAFYDEHLAAADEDGCSCKAHRILAQIRKDVLREVKEIYDDGGTSRKVYNWMLTQLAERPAPAGEVHDEVAWLIERAGLCLGSLDRNFKWVSFTDICGLRFSRRSDAVRFIEAMHDRMNLSDVLVTEHSWAGEVKGEKS